MVKQLGFRAIGSCTLELPRTVAMASSAEYVVLRGLIKANSHHGVPLDIAEMIGHFQLLELTRVLA